MREDSLFAIKVIGGLLALITLAYLGGTRRVVRFQERLGIGGVITAGFPLVALGVIAALPSVDVLGPDTVERLKPILGFGLGWLGFVIGAQLDIRVLDRVPKGTAYLILVEALGPFGVTAAGCGAVMMLAFDLSWKDPAVWRDILMSNREEILKQAQRFRHALDAVEHVINTGNAEALEALITSASEARSSWQMNATTPTTAR